MKYLLLLLILSSCGARKCVDNKVYQDFNGVWIEQNHYAGCKSPKEVE